MRVIKDSDSLVLRLENENKEWQKIIYEATGVIITESLDLFSNCGYFTSDSMWEFTQPFDEEDAEWCEINTICEMIEFITSLDQYSKTLANRSFGLFTKADLFCAIQERVLRQRGNMNEDGEQDWMFSSITHYDDCVYVNGALKPCAPVEIQIYIDASTTLDDALESFVKELNSELNGHDWLTTQKIYYVDVDVPNTYEKTMNMMRPGGLLA